MAQFKVVGQSIPRLDALEKVTGKAKFCVDVKLPGMLYGRVLRSPYAHARIVSIDTSKAEKLKGVRVVVTGRDAPEGKYGLILADQYIPTRDVARFIGEGVAAVAADTPEIAQEALDLIEVKYEELPAVFDPEEAFSSNCPVVIHPDLPSYQPVREGHKHTIVPGRPNVFNHYKIRLGDVELGFKESDLVLENRFTTARISRAQMEPENCVAALDPDGTLVLWTSLQSIFRIRALLCMGFGLPATKVRVVSSHYLGGAFGGYPKVEQFAALLAFKTGRPVKMVLTREEVFIGTNSRVPMDIRVKDGVKRDGTLVAREVKIVVSGGAYADSVPIIAKLGATVSVATYRVPNLKLDSYAVYTNEPIGGPFRGFGAPQVMWAIESQMDIIAENLGMDRVSVRKKNLLKEGERNAAGEVTHSIAAEECLDEVARWIEWDKKPAADGAWRRGKGIALGNKHSGIPTASCALVKIEEDGAVQLRHSADEIGQGCNTILAQIVAEELNVPVDSVKVIRGDTAITPYDWGSVASRTTFATGNAVRLAAQDARRQLLELASSRLEVPPEELETKDGRIFVKNTNTSIPIFNLFSQSLPRGTGYIDKGAEIMGRATWSIAGAPTDPETGQTKRLSAFFIHGAQAAEVAVDTETGQVKVLRFGGAFDMGQPINPKLCESQMEGGAGMGIGSTIYEEMIMDKGRVTNPNFLDYRVPTIKDLPSGDNVAAFIDCAPHRDGPYGAKGLGEGILAPTAPAIASAVFDAIGVRIKDLPLSPERVLKALREKEGKEKLRE